MLLRRVRLGALALLLAVSLVPAADARLALAVGHGERLVSHEGYLVTADFARVACRATPARSASRRPP